MAEIQLLNSVFPVATPLPQVVQLPIGTTMLLDRVANRGQNIRKAGQVFQRLVYSPNNVVVKRGAKKCGDDFAQTGTGAYWEEYKLQDNTVSVEVFRLKEADIIAMNAGSQSAMGTIAGLTPQSLVGLGFDNAISAGRTEVNKVLFSILLANIGNNPVNNSSTPPSVSIVTSGFSGQTEPYSEWEVPVQEALLRNGLDVSRFTKLASSPYVTLKSLQDKLITGGSTNIDLRRTPSLSYYDPLVDSSDPMGDGTVHGLYEDEFDNILYVMDGAFTLDFASRVSATAPLGSMMNDAIISDLRSNFERIFTSEMVAGTTYKMIWLDPMGGIFWDVFMNKTDCDGDVEYKMWIETNPQLIYNHQNYIKIPGFKGVFTVGACKRYPVSCSPAETDYSAPVENCLTDFALDGCPVTFPSGLEVEITQTSGGSLALTATMPIAISTTPAGLLQVLRGFKNDGRYLVVRSYGSGDSLGATINLPIGDYDISFGACGVGAFSVIECESGTVIDPIAVLNAQRTASNQSAEETQIFTIATGDPLIGSTALIVNSHFTDVIVQKKSTGVDSKILINPDDYTFDATTHTITLIVAIAAGDVFEIIGA